MYLLSSVPNLHVFCVLFPYSHFPYLHLSADLDNVTSATSHTTSFESNTDAIVAGEGGGEGGPAGDAEVVDVVEASRDRVPSEVEVSQPPITLPSSEARRTSYRAILANRLKVN